MSTMDPVVDVRGLTVRFGATEVVRSVDLQLLPGRCLALVGESGSGKSVTARALVGLSGGTVRADKLMVAGHNTAGFSERAWRRLRGRDVGTVLQNALGSLDPLRSVGREVADAARLAGVPLDLPALLRAVGLDPDAAARRPDELSGGMRQRALIAAALAADPAVVIADEPTTALDTTRQAVVLELLRARVDAGGALLFITHDLAAARRVADDVLVLDQGRVVERGSIDHVLDAPGSGQAQRLVASVPWERPRGERLLGQAERAAEPSGVEQSVGAAEPVAPVLTAQGLVVRHRGAPTPTINRVDLELWPGRTLGLVGESGSGKSTVLRAVAALIPLQAGEIRLNGAPWSALPERARRPQRRQLAMMVQDPLGSFEPRWNVGRLLQDALGRKDPARIRELLDAVHLLPSVADAHPRTLSGGQRQRVAIARALAVEPAILLCDEPVSALDASVQARVLDLLDELQQERGLAILLVSHDLGVIRHASDEVAVLDAGVIVERGATESVLAAPQHPFTRELIQAAPRLR